MGGQPYGHLGKSRKENAQNVPWLKKAASNELDRDLPSSSQTPQYTARCQGAVRPSGKDSSSHYVTKVLRLSPGSLLVANDEATPG